MSKRIRHVSELPDWFRLENYEQAESLNVAGWFQQLAIRRSMSFWTKQDMEQIPEIAAALDLLRNQPIIDTSIESPIKTLLGRIIAKPKLGVRSMNAHELYMIEKNIALEKRKYARRYANQFGFGKIPLRVVYSDKDWLKYPLCDLAGREAVGAIMVDLELPDSILVENFRQYLVTLREETHKNIDFNKPYSHRAFDSWWKFGLLPYLDLQIWQKEVDVSIPYRVLADAIYATGEGGEETVRKTTAPLAERLFLSLYLLQAQAAQWELEHNTVENPEQNKE